MNILVTVAHPRKDSLTFSLMHALLRGLADAGHHTEVLDLYRSDFDPVLKEDDEPVWAQNEQIYSSKAEEEMQRMNRHEALVYVFPLWWWNMPAILKGYIDRVWNYGYAYGPFRLAHQKVLWLTIAGAPQERFEKRQYDRMMEHYFNVGLANYVGIQESQFHLLVQGIAPSQELVEYLLQEAYEQGRNFA